MDLSELMVDPQLYEDGKKVDWGDGSYIRVRASNSDAAQKVRKRLWKPYDNWDPAAISPELQTRITCDWIAQGILTEFVGFSLDGQPFPIDLTNKDDRDKLSALLQQPRSKALRNRIYSHSADDGQFKADAALEKN